MVDAQVKKRINELGGKSVDELEDMLIQDALEKITKALQAFRERGESQFQIYVEYARTAPEDSKFAQFASDRLSPADIEVTVEFLKEIKLLDPEGGLNSLQKSIVVLPMVGEGSNVIIAQPEFEKE